MLRASENAVHVWRSSTRVSPSRLAALSRLLSPDEADRSARFFFEPDRRRYVVARGLLRELLGHYLRFSPAALCFRYGPYGKPELAVPAVLPAVHFNVSHSGELILLAVASGRRIGIDVEYVRNLPDASDLAMRFFSPRERAAFARLPPDLQQAAFFACWTRKESFIKAIGEGLSHPLDAFDVPVEPETPPRLFQTRSDPGAAARWRMCEVDPGPGYAATLTVEGHEWDLKYWNVHESIESSITRISVSTPAASAREA